MFQDADEPFKAARDEPAPVTENVPAVPRWKITGGGTGVWGLGFRWDYGVDLGLYRGNGKKTESVGNIGVR